MPQESKIVGTFCCSTATVGPATFRETGLGCAAGEAKDTEGTTEKNAVCCESISNDLASMFSEAVQQLPLP